MILEKVLLLIKNQFLEKEVFEKLGFFFHHGFLKPDSITNTNRPAFRQIKMVQRSFQLN